MAALEVVLSAKVDESRLMPCPECGGDAYLVHIYASGSEEPCASTIGCFDGHVGPGPAP